MKILILFIYLGFSLLNGQLLEELDDFKKLKKNFNIDPSFIEKNDGLWYNGIVDNLFTAADEPPTFDRLLTMEEIMACTECYYELCREQFQKEISSLQFKKNI